jgi:hypothetical protein
MKLNFDATCCSGKQQELPDLLNQQHRRVACETRALITTILCLEKQQEHNLLRTNNLRVLLMKLGFQYDYLLWEASGT